MNIHMIAIGGSIMHNLAIALKKKGYKINGSDDKIFEPAKSNLKDHALLPEKEGWYPEKITSEIDLVILGMHAQKDNAELIKTQEIGLNIVSFPEFFARLCKNKTRVVIAGSHGKTTITSMIMHVLKYYGKNFDYLVGAKVDGFQQSVKITEDAPIIILEGDEYLSSCIDDRPKFLWYKPHIAIISGISWDHINVFPDPEIYYNQFEKFAKTIVKGGHWIYYQGDKQLENLKTHLNPDIKTIAYDVPEYKVVEDTGTEVQINNNKYLLKIFGRHNLANLSGASIVCEKLGIDQHKFYEAIKTFKGAGKRLEKIESSQKSIVYKDFAHAPSKVLATVDAVSEQYPDKSLIAILELHTYSSLNKKFILNYKDCMKNAVKKYVFIEPETLKLKNLPEIEAAYINKAFNDKDVILISTPDILQKIIETELSDQSKNKVFLFMSSGNFGGLNVEKLF